MSVYRSNILVCLDFSIDTIRLMILDFDSIPVWLYYMVNLYYHLQSHDIRLYLWWLRIKRWTEKINGKKGIRYFFVIKAIIIIICKSKWFQINCCFYYNFKLLTLVNYIKSIYWIEDEIFFQLFKFVWIIHLLSNIRSVIGQWSLNFNSTKMRILNPFIFTIFPYESIKHSIILNYHHNHQKRGAISWKKKKKSQNTQGEWKLFFIFSFKAIIFVSLYFDLEMTKWKRTEGRECWKKS